MKVKVGTTYPIAFNPAPQKALWGCSGESTASKGNYDFRAFLSPFMVICVGGTGHNGARVTEATRRVWLSPKGEFTND